MDRSKKENPRENYFLSLKECVNPKHFKRVALLEKKTVVFSVQDGDNYSSER